MGRRDGAAVVLLGRRKVPPTEPLRLYKGGRANAVPGVGRPAAPPVTPRVRPSALVTAPLGVTARPTGGLA